MAGRASDWSLMMTRNGGSSCAASPASVVASSAVRPAVGMSTSTVGLVGSGARGAAQRAEPRLLPCADVVAVVDAVVVAGEVVVTRSRPSSGTDAARWP